MKRRYKSKAEIPEGLEALYEEKDGVWVLKLEDDDGGGGDDKVKTFRENNIKLQKQLKDKEELLARFKDLDPDNVDELLTFKQKLNENEELKLLAEGKYDVVKERWTGNLKKSLQDQITKAQQTAEAEQKAAAKFKNRLKDVLLEKQIGDVVGGLGSPKKGAMRDIFNRAREVFDIDDDGEKLVPRDGTADPDGAPWTPEKWGQHLVTEEAPYLFETSSGSGSQGNKTASPAKGVRWVDADAEQLGRILMSKEYKEGRVKIRGYDVG